MTSRPASIRNVAWAVVRDGAAPRHVYRRDVDLFLKDAQHRRDYASRRASADPSEPVLDGTGMLALPGLVNIHRHPTTEPGYRGVREDHGVPEQQMTGLIERLQAFRLGKDGRRRRPRCPIPRCCAPARRRPATSPCRSTAGSRPWRERHALYAAPTFASARWGMAAPQTVTWKWDEAGGLAHSTRQGA